MARAFYLLFGLAAYALFFAAFLYLIAFVGDLPGIPRSVDHGGAGGPAAGRILVDLALIALFGLQHSVMARQGFKKGWTRIVPPPIERSVYVLATTIVLVFLFEFWRPLEGTIWNVANPIGAAILWGLFGIGWLVVLLSTFLINHFELFGLNQVWDHARGRASAPPKFRQPAFYRLVRHPLYSGFFLAFWVAPRMSAGHLLLAVGFSIYILIAIRYEERDLVQLFGEDYEDYRRRTGMLTPRMRRAP